MACLCTPPPPVDVAAAGSTIARQFTETGGAASCRGADLSIVFNGERHKAGADACRPDPDSFTFDVFTPWGERIASIVADTARAVVTAGNRVMETGLDESVATFAGFSRFPVTFRNLVRILSGTFPRYCFDPASRVDSVWSQKRNTTYRWRTDSSVTEMALDSRKGILVSVAHNRIGDSSYQTVFSRFSGSIPHRISLKADENNYFILQYDKTETTHEKE